MVRPDPEESSIRFRFRVGVLGEGSASPRVGELRGVIRGRARRCASQQGNAPYAAVVLGLLDERCHRLARLLLRWQWPDG